jgi:hypothetical protein
MESVELDTLSNSIRASKLKRYFRATCETAG